MRHPDLGDVDFDDQTACWTGTLRLPAFDGFSVRWTPPQRPEADTAALLRHARASLESRLSSFIGRDGMAELNAAMDRVAESARDAPEPPPVEQPHPSRPPLGPGEFRLRVEGQEPCEQQARALREFLKAEPRNSRAILDSVHGYYRDVKRKDREWYGEYPDPKRPDDMRDLIRLEGVHLSRYHRRGVAYMGFTFECVWDDEHGLGVLWHNGRVIDVGHYDTIDAIRRADNLREPEEWTATPNQTLLAAMFGGAGEQEIQRLVAQGADINHLERGASPPLCMAVIQMQPAAVERLLAFGADPSLRDAQGMTALDHARRMQGTLAPANSPMAALLSRMQGPHANAMTQMTEHIDTMVRLLEEAEQR